MQGVTGTGLVDLEQFVVLLGNVIVCVDTDFVGVPTVRNGGIDTNGAVLLVIDGANFETVLVTTEQTRLLAAVARRLAPHDRGLGKDTGSTVGVGSVFGVNGGEGNGVLVILSQVEVTREPGLDATVFADQFNVLTAGIFVGMVQPAATVDDVVFLQDTQTRTIGRSMGKDK